MLAYHLARVQATLKANKWDTLTFQWPGTVTPLFVGLANIYHAISPSPHIPQSTPVPIPISYFKLVSFNVRTKIT